jgi:hypothetical protein
MSGGGESAGEAVEALDVDGPKLLDEDAGVLTRELDLGPECQQRTRECRSARYAKAAFGHSYAVWTSS